MTVSLKQLEQIYAGDNQKPDIMTNISVLATSYVGTCEIWENKLEQVIMT